MKIKLVTILYYVKLYIVLIQISSGGIKIDSSLTVNARFLNTQNLSMSLFKT